MAAGDLSRLQDDAECQFLVDFMAAAPTASPATAIPSNRFTPLPSWAESTS